MVTGLHNWETIEVLLFFLLSSPLLSTLLGPGHLRVKNAWNHLPCLPAIQLWATEL